MFVHTAHLTSCSIYKQQGIWYFVHGVLYRKSPATSTFILARPNTFHQRLCVGLASLRLTSKCHCTNKSIIVQQFTKVHPTRTRLFL